MQTNDPSEPGPLNNTAARGRACYFEAGKTRPALGKLFEPTSSGWLRRKTQTSVIGRNGLRQLAKLRFAWAEGHDVLYKFKSLAGERGGYGKARCSRKRTMRDCSRDWLVHKV
jgi:hypothetical protein